MPLLADEAYSYVHMLRNVACEGICTYFGLGELPGLADLLADEGYLYVYLLTKVACEANLYVFLLRRAPKTCPDLDFQKKLVSLHSIGPFQLTPELSLQIPILAS